MMTSKKIEKHHFFVIPARRARALSRQAEAGIQSIQGLMKALDSGYRIESGTSFTGVTTFYEPIKHVSDKKEIIQPIH